MNKTAILTACTLGAVIGAASYFLRSSPPVPAADITEEQSVASINADEWYWSRQSAQSYVMSYERLACRVLYGEHYRPSDNNGTCEPPVDCRTCVSSKGVAHNAVIHDNAWVRAPKAGGPDYAAMMRQDKLVFQMAMAEQGSIEAGRRAYDHTVRCQRVYAGADVQCKN